MAFYWVGWSLESVQKNYLPYLIHVGVITAHICGYITIISYMDLTIASNFFLAG